MICIKCGHSNPDSLNYCEKCNAHLVKMAFASAPTSSIEVEEGKSYLSPQRSYPTEHLYNLTCRAVEYVDQGASGDPLLEAYKIVQERMDEFETESLPALLQAYQSEKVDVPEDDYSSQMIYLLKIGVAKYREGFAMMDQFIASGENATLIQAVHTMQYGNDHLGLAGELATLRGQKIEEELEKIRTRQRAAAAAKPHGTTPSTQTQGTTPAEECLDTVAEPVDRGVVPVEPPPPTA